MEKCKNCGAKFVKFPVKKQPDKTFAENYKEGTVNWINFIKMDLNTIVLLLVVGALITGYKWDMEICEGVIEDPCEFCEYSNCCQCGRCYKEQLPDYFDTTRSNYEFPDFNIT